MLPARPRGRTGQRREHLEVGGTQDPRAFLLTGSGDREGATAKIDRGLGEFAAEIPPQPDLVVATREHQEVSSERRMPAPEPGEADEGTNHRSLELMLDRDSTVSRSVDIPADPGPEIGSVSLLSVLNANCSRHFTSSISSMNAGSR